VAQVRPAITCTDSWKVATSGLWSTASNWSTGAAPTSTSAACINLAGTYTVSLIGTGSVGTLTLGGASGTQTLLVQGTPGTNSILTISTATGSDIASSGVFQLDTQSGGGYGALEGGSGVTLTNDGTFETTSEGTNVDYIEAGLTNDPGATVSIAGANTHQDETTTTTNNGTFTVTGSGLLALSSASTLTDSGGTLTDSGSLTLNNSKFIQSGGAETGNTVALSNASTLTDSVGVGKFSMEGNDALSGTIPAGQNLTVIGAPGTNSVATLSGNVSNNGTLALDSQSGGGYADVYNGGVTGVTLTNNGTFKTLADGTNVTYIEANLTNSSTGTVTIDSSNSKQDQGTTTTNSGSFTVASGGVLALTSASVFTDTSGTVSDVGTFTLNNSTFNQSGGVESNGTVALSNASTLNDSAGGGAFSMVNTDDLNGTIPSGQTVSVLGVPGANSIAQLGAAGVTNDGTFVLDSQSGGGYADVNGGTLTNNGLFKTAADGTNVTYIDANLTNSSTGTVTIASSASKQDVGTTTTNNGLFSVADGGVITLSGGSIFTQGSAGTFSATVDATNGAFGLTGGTDTLAGTLAINTVGSPTLGTKYNVITAATSVTGTFSSLSFGPHAYIVGYTATTVTVTVATPFSLTGSNAHLTEDTPDASIKVATGTAGSQSGAIYTASINWGDSSSPSAGKVKVSGSKLTVTGSHTYTAPGTYTVTTTMSDQFGTTITVTSTATVVVPAAPTVTSASPSTVLLGASNKTLTLAGTAFTDNAIVTFSNSGITVVSVTYKSTKSLQVKIDVARTAPTGAGNITVTTPGGSGTCTGCLSVDAPPTVTSVSAPLAPGATTTVTVTGTGFQTGLTVTTDISGATVGAPTLVTATSFSVAITVLSGTAAASNYHLTVTNPDGGTVTYKHLAVS
jgi:hypothetical protein